MICLKSQVQYINHVLLRIVTGGKIEQILPAALQDLAADKSVADETRR